MSTSTCLEPGPEHSAAAPRERLVSGPLAWLLLSSYPAAFALAGLLILVARPAGRRARPASPTVTGRPDVPR
jgi:hypothetical protein